MSEMEAVNSFNAELQSLYDVKPPISKGKMTAITRAALKAVKLYKHAVQSVEKFIQKCKPEYKIPGLYVIDSIIRQSRHQFGPEKDVFATRFARNIQTTFVHLYKCPDEDKAKVIRVLNLWQKNRIFSPEVIQPLFDLADPNNPIWETVQQNMMEYPTGGSGNNSSSNGNALQSSNNIGNSTSLGSSKINDSGGFLPPVHFKKELLDYDYDEEEDMDGAGHPPPNHHSYQHQQNSSMGPGGHEMNHNPLAGFDALGSILTNPEVLRQLQTLQEQMAAAAQQQQQQQMAYLNPEQERQRKLAELNKQEAAFDQRLAQTVARLPFAVDCDLPFSEGNDGKRSPRKDGNSSSGFMQSGSVDQNSNQLANNQNPGILLPPPFFQQLTRPDHKQQHQQQGVPSHHEQNQHQQNQQNMMGVQQNNPFGIPLTFPVQGVPPAFPQQDMSMSQNMGMFNPQMVLDEMNRPFSGFSQMPPQQFEQQNVNNIGDEKDRDRRERDRRRRRSRSNERKNRSRSRSPSKARRKSRSTSRNRNRKRYKSRSRSRDRKEEREKEKERQRKGLPPVKREHLSVCTTTLWVGHLSKLVSQEEISDTFGSYGDIVSIDVIPPRGCAFVVMNRRQDACRALDRLKNTKLQGKTITLAWAPGKGVKGRDWKDYWEVEAGVSYIPWGKLKLDTNIDEFEDGGCIDEDTVPEFIKNRPKPPEPSHEKAPPLPSPSDEVPDAPANETSVPSSQPQQPVSALLPTPGIPSLLGAPPVPDPVIVSSSGDTDSRPEVAALTHSATSNAMGPGPNMNPGSFPMPPPVNMMGVPPMGMNMMVPPPLMGTNMQGFQGLGGMPNLPNMSMMGMLGGNMNVGNQGMVPPPMGAPGLLGDMPNTMPQALAVANMQQHMQMNNSLNIHSNDDTERLSEEDRKRRGDRRDNRIKKRSRFDDVEDRRSPAPPTDIDNRNSPVHNNDRNSKDERPLFERLKSIAEGYGFGGVSNDQPINMNNLNNSLLGAPIGPVGSGPRAPGPMERMPNPHGFPQPLLPMGPGHGPGSGPGNQFGPRLPFIGERPQGLAGPGPRPWFDNSNVQNPFMNPNPFAGNPFIQTNLSENPFEMGGPGQIRPGDPGHPGGNNGPGPGPFFGRDMGNFGNRGGGRGGHHHPPGPSGPQGQDEGEFWGRGGRGGGGRGRGGRGSGGGGGNWRGRWEEEDPQWDRDNDQNFEGNGPEGRDRDNNRGFRGGRGGGRGGGRDNWQPRDRDRNDRDRESRDRDRERDHPRDRESRGREREKSREKTDRNQTDRSQTDRNQTDRNQTDRNRDRDRENRDRDRSGRDRGRDRDRRDRRRSTEDTDRKDRDHRNSSSNGSSNHPPPQVIDLDTEENWEEGQGEEQSTNTPQEVNVDGPPPEPLPEIDQNVSNSEEQEQEQDQEENPDYDYAAEENENNENEESVQENPQDNSYSNSEYQENENTQAEEFEEFNENENNDNGQYDDKTENNDNGQYDDKTENNDNGQYDDRTENNDNGQYDNTRTENIDNGPYDNDTTEDNKGGNEENYEDVENGGEDYPEEPEHFDRHVENPHEPPFCNAPHQEESYMESEDVNYKSTNLNRSHQNQIEEDGYENENPSEYVNENEDVLITRRDSVHLDTTESQKEPIADLTDSVQLDKETNDNDNVNINSNE